MSDKIWNNDSTDLNSATISGNSTIFSQAENIANVLKDELNNVLQKFFRERTEHSLSANMPESAIPWANSYYEQLKSFPNLSRKEISKIAAKWKENNTSKQLYTTNLDEYERKPKGSKGKKYEFIKDDANTWRKIHLNVKAEDVVDVSTYLKNEGYYHKFLHGGLPETGTVFTLYIGSYALAHPLSQKISTDLKERLLKPIDHNEIELAVGVIGRFNCRRDYWNKYGTCWFSLLEKDYNKDFAWNQELREITSFKSLLEMYGEYFFKQ